MFIVDFVDEAHILVCYLTGQFFHELGQIKGQTFLVLDLVYPASCGALDDELFLTDVVIDITIIPGLDHILKNKNKYLDFQIFKTLKILFCSQLRTCAGNVNLQIFTILQVHH